MRTTGITSTVTFALASIFTLHAFHGGSFAYAARQAGQQEQQKSLREDADKLIQGSDCRSCHDIDRKVVGPGYQDIAQKYAGQADASDKLVHSIREGGSGHWGDIPMTPHPNLKDSEAKQIVTWILSLKKSDASSDSTPKTPAKEYTYTLKDGKTVKLEFPLFVEGSDQKVTKSVFRGYELYNSYCFRCHGQDVTESELAPDLKRSLNSGLTTQEFVSTTMAGREPKGMPSWAGFFTEDEVKQILSYVQARRYELVSVGRPPSEGE